MEEEFTTESEVQVENVQPLVVIASILFGLVVIVAAVSLWNRRTLKMKMVEALPEGQ